MTDRIPLLQLGSLQSRLPELIAKKGAPPWSEPGSARSHRG